jgi:hypothetical protein
MRRDELAEIKDQTVVKEIALAAEIGEYLNELNARLS